MVIKSEEWEMWRIAYSKYKLKPSEKKILQQNLDEISYTCGFMFADLHFNGKLANVLCVIFKVWRNCTITAVVPTTCIP